ncbi:hypothetical protein B0J11DRAFT_232772 [Dendryphion nanum]|uniref:Uncharacterized protein n=1 Tax=Dendryphion nanum TaxID=256645 RepID=A0A9P9E8S4_9PLEO|nr:hypothetical protein B0J11DRAFT_232772 [Dendryphion nanum]
MKQEKKGEEEDEEKQEKQGQKSQAIMMSLFIISDSAGTPVNCSCMRGTGRADITEQSIVWNAGRICACMSLVGRGQCTNAPGQGGEEARGDTGWPRAGQGGRSNKTTQALASSIIQARHAQLAFRSSNAQVDICLFDASNTLDTLDTLNTLDSLICATVVWHTKHTVETPLAVIIQCRVRLCPLLHCSKLPSPPYAGLFTTTDRPPSTDDTRFPYEQGLSFLRQSHVHQCLNPSTTPHYLPQPPGTTIL